MLFLVSNVEEDEYCLPSQTHPSYPPLITSHHHPLIITHSSAQMSDEKLETHQPSESLDQAFENHFKLSGTRKKSLLQPLYRHEQNFQWTPLWFETYETLILEISYFPQLFSKVDRAKEFMRQKIISTHVSQFNEFLRLSLAPLIDHHYDWLKKNPEKISWGNLSGNSQAIEIITARLDDFKFINQHLQQVPVEWIQRNKDYMGCIADHRLSWWHLSSNPGAVEILKAHPMEINWWGFSANTQAMEILKIHPEKIYWGLLSENPSAMEILKKYPEKIRWSNLSKNPRAIELLRANPEKINWNVLSTNPGAIDLLRANPEKITYSVSQNTRIMEIWEYCQHIIDWSSLSLNVGAIELLQKNPGKIDWFHLSKNPRAIELLKEHPEKIDWPNLSSNPGAIELLKDNLEKINWSTLSSNPGAIELLKANPDKIIWEYLCLNNYDYKQEKIQAFNQLNLLSRSGIKIKN